LASPAVTTSGDRALGYVDVDLGDGIERRFKYTGLAAIRLKQALGKAVGSIGDLKNVDESDLIYLAWALLLHEEPRLTVEKVAEVVDLKKMADIGGKIGDALRIAFTENDGRPLATRRQSKSRTG
jgi:hypothetical protein